MPLQQYRVIEVKSSKNLLARRYWTGVGTGATDDLTKAFLFGPTQRPNADIRELEKQGRNPKLITVFVGPSKIATGVSAPLSSPVLLTFNTSGGTWSWSGTNPVNWLIQHSTDNGNTWNTNYTATGSARSLSGGLYQAGWQISIIGVDGNNNIITGRSNKIQI